MNMNFKHIFFVVSVLGLSASNGVQAQTDTIRQSRLKRYWNSLVHGNIDRTYERKMDMSYVLAPCYAREGSLGIGGAATGLYRLDRTDSIMQPSDISLSGSATVKGFYAVTVKGNNHFRGNRSRLSYILQFQNKNLDFWGVSYDACAANPVSGYRRQMINWESDYVYKLTKDFHVGAALNLNYTRASLLTRPEYLNGQRSSYFFTGIGVSVQYDTRDFILNPKRGIYFLAREVFYPKWLSSYNKTIFSTTVIFDAYQKAWKGSVLALDFYGQFNGDDVPWTLREELAAARAVCVAIIPGGILITTSFPRSWNFVSISMDEWVVWLGQAEERYFHHLANFAGKMYCQTTGWGSGWSSNIM